MYARSTLPHSYRKRGILPTSSESDISAPTVQKP